MSAAPQEPTLTFVHFFAVKVRLATNYLRDFKRHFVIHVAVALGTLTFLLLGGFSIFAFLFDFLLDPDQQPFGEPLLRRLLGMVFLAFFSMLTFSNLIITLTTTYISREVEFYMAQPMGHRRLFFCKLAESTLYSSWAFLILSLPLIVAMGRTARPPAPWTFYPLALLSYIPFVVLPSVLGATIVLIVTAYIPARRTFRLAVALGGGTVVLALLLGRFTSVGSGWVGNQQEGISRIMRFMGVGDIVWMPSTWLARSVRAALVSDWTEVFFWVATLVATTLMALQVCYWLAGRLYYRGYVASRSSSSSGRSRSGGVYGFFDKVLRPISSSSRSLIVKDLAVFWRDPAQWGQLVILFGLLFLYIVNLGGASELSGIRDALPFWKTLVSLFNVGTTSFVLSILSTRFVFPMLSLEGKQQWVIGLAPISRTRLVWVKYFVACLSSLALTLPLIVLSCWVLGTDRFVTVISIVSIIVMSLVLNSLAVGLGALLPNFNEDNPSRIANGLGGTLNVILSLIYIGSSVALLAPMMWNHVRPPDAGGSLAQVVAVALAVWALVQIVVGIVPMAIGLRHWKRLEF